MAKFEILMPKMGESIIEATITKWLKSKGEAVGEDESIAEIATDKVDSEIPSPVEGTIAEILFKEGDVVPVGKVIAVIDLGGEEAGPAPAKEIVAESSAAAPAKSEALPVSAETQPAGSQTYAPGGRF